MVSLYMKIPGTASAGKEATCAEYYSPCFTVSSEAAPLCGRRSGG